MERKDKKALPPNLRDRLYGPVLSLFASSDFHEVNIRSLSAQTGISTRTIYKYFDSKEDLLFTIIDEKLSELGDLMRMHIGGLKSGREIFRKIFWVTMDFFDRNPDLAVTAFVTVPLKSFMESGVYRRESELDIVQEVVKIAKGRGDVDPGIGDSFYIDFYFMICHRHIHNWYFHGKKWSLAEKVDSFFDYFWRVVDPENGGV